MKKFVSLIMMLVLALNMMTTPAMAEAPVDLLWVPTVLNGSSIYPGSDSFVAQKINEMFNVNITATMIRDCSARFPWICSRNMLLPTMSLPPSASTLIPFPVTLTGRKPAFRPGLCTFHWRKR